MMRALSDPIEKSLSLKLLTAFISVVIVVLAAYTLYAVSRERNKVRNELSSQGDMLAELLAYSSRVGVFAENRDLLKEAASGILAQRPVVRVAIYNADYRLLYAGRKDPLARRGRGGQGIEAAANGAAPSQDAMVAESRNTAEFTKPVVIKRIADPDKTVYFDDEGARRTEKTIGYVSIVLEKETERKEILDIIRRNAVITLVFMLASAGVIYWQVKKMTRPLKKLTEGVNALGLGDEVGPVTVETRDEIGNLASAFNTMVGRRKQAEEALRHSENKYRTLFEESKDVIFIETPDERIIDINPAGIELYGRSSKEECLALNVKRDLYLKPDDRDALKRALETAGFVKDYEVKLRKKDGEIITGLITATVVRDAAGRTTAYRGIIRDVTAERLLEDQLIHAQKMEAVGQLTGGIAHDFNNILSAIISYGYLLQMDLQKNSPLQAYVENLLASAERAANLTKSLLAFSRKQVLDRKPVDLNHVIRKVEKLLSKIIGEDIDIRTKLTQKDVMVVADGGQLEQVLMNFATNARDAMPNGGTLTIETERVDAGDAVPGAGGNREPSPYACISATDTGTGMDEATRKKIFDPFFTTKEVGKGTGLGLSIVYGIVKQHNGLINVFSEPGKGTTFKVYLPLRSAEAERDKPTVAPARVAGGTESILVAEDDEEVRKLARIVLRKFGYRLLEAKDGDEALEKFILRKDDIDLVILDVVMPKKNGRQACEEMRKLRPGVKVLFVSGYTPDNLRKRDMLEEGMHYLFKPVSPEVLLRKVREVLNS